MVDAAARNRLGADKEHKRPRLHPMWSNECVPDRASFG